LKVARSDGVLLLEGSFAMNRQTLTYGGLAGLIVGLPLFTMTLLIKGQPPLAWGMAIGFLTMLAAFSLIFVAIKQRRDRSETGTIKFWPAFGQGLAITLIASVIYVAAWEAALAVSGIDFAGDYARAYLQQQAEKGVSGQTLAKLTADMEVFKANYAKPAYRLAMTLTEIAPVGVLVSLVSAGLLSNRKFLAPKSQ
jgi:Protein of unknown function (DUF4199)